MAKGSGGVGKKSGSVSGAKVKAAAPAAKAAGDLMSAPIGEFASAVYGAFDKVQINDGAPISDVFAAMPNKGNMTLDQFKSRLREGYMSDKIGLGRNDMGLDRYSTKTLRESVLNDRGREYVFVLKMY